MLKHTKKLLAIMLAMAVVAMSMFTGFAVSATSTGTVDLLEFGDYLLEAGSASKWYDTVLADNGETGDSWENAIIIDSAEEFVYLCKASGDDTIGKYYKVADGIKGFDLTKGDIDLDGTLAENIDKIKAGGKNHAGGTPGFQGSFDGNGVTVYGAWTNHNEGNVSAYAGLFGCTKGNVTIKNVNVKMAHFTAKNAAGGIVGYHTGDGTQVLTIENCSVVDSYLEVQGTGFGQGVGAIIGYSSNLSSWKEADKQVDGNGDGDMLDTIYINGAINISNCYVNLNEANFVSKAEDGVEDSGERSCHGGVAGAINTNALMVRDCLVIGIKPYATMEGTSANDVQHSGLESHFANVYTTSDVAITGVNLGGSGALNNRNFTGKVFPLADAQLKGEAALSSMNLDWSVWMADDEGYPELRSMHKDVTFVDNGNGTHGETCACGFGGVASKHIWEDGKCACGATLNCAGRDTIYWDGTIATGIATGTGTKDDPYVINTAAEFAWLVQNAKIENTQGKYFEIAENIGAIVLQNKEFAQDIIDLENADAVAAFFENEDYIFTGWPHQGWESGCFCGIFDGNGATVYGLYQVSENNAGLFSNVDAGAVIKNIGLKNSYLTSTAGNYQVGGLAAVTNGSTYQLKANGAIWFDSCVVANNYMYNPCTSHDRTGVIIGASSDMIYIENCLVYGNNATYGDGVQAAIWSSGQNSQIVTGNEIIPEGLVTKNDGAETPRYYNVVRNSIILGAKPYDLGQQVGSRFNDPKCYEYSYTDADIANDVFSNGAVLNVAEDQLKQVTLGELATLALGDAWYNTATYPELKVFHDDNLAVTPNNDGTHGSVCSCGTVFKAPCTFVDGACSACGAKMTCATKRTIYWNGGISTGFAQGTGTKADPYIINSAEELAYLVTCKADVTAGKYFEIAEDIGTIVLQAQDMAADITALNSAAAVQSYFENDEYVFTEWPEKGWEQSCFAGNFDGNGVKVYGLYLVSDTNAGLFSTVDAGAAIHNIAVLNSYMVSNSTSANYQVGAIAAVASNGTYGIGTNGLIWLEGCTVGNCYMRNDGADAARSGVLFGAASSDAVVIDNCLVYGNDARHSVTAGDYSLAMPLINLAVNSVIAPAVVPEGLDAKIQENANANGNSMYYNSVRNTIAFGTDLMNVNTARSHRRNDPPTFENCYTDAAAGTVAFTDGEWTYDESQIKSVTLQTLNDNDLGDAWIKTSGYPELKAAHIAEITDNGDGTHAVSCPCGAVSGEAEEHTYVDGACSVCGSICAHIAGEAVEENRVEATCKAEGSYDEVVYCTECGVEMSRDTKVIEKAAHTPSEEVEENCIDSTCKTPGSCDRVVYCTVCDEEISRNTVELPLDPDNHTYDNEDDADCNECGEVRELYVLGDANGDGEVDNKDYAVLMQSINGWDVEINEAAADVYKDGKIDNKDYAILMQYLNNWDVTLGEQA